MVAFHSVNVWAAEWQREQACRLEVSLATQKTLHHDQQ